SAVNSYSTYTAEAKKAPTAKSEAADTKVKEEAGVVYEPSKEEAVTEKPVGNKNKIADPDLVAKLQADADARVAQFKALVEQLISKQANTYGNANDIWAFLREGNFTVDPATKAQAEADIAEDGYWGVEQTSDRIIDFAKALAGDDPEQLNKMLDGFKKGFKQAEKTWGGELPEISKKTYDAVLKKFDELINKPEQSEA
ncbi:MAG: hypothetical protein J6U15_02315, partial [Lachnospiraceae bacterium]|nr:hypothetical protein [Lachnospiraceae bacterium]